MSRPPAILFEVDLKLVILALEEAGKETDGFLFGESFVKNMDRYVGKFMAIEKAQNSMCKVFSNRVSTRSRGCLFGHASFGTLRGFFSQASFQGTRNAQTFSQLEADVGPQGRPDAVAPPEDLTVSPQASSLSSLPPVGGRLRCFSPAWEDIILDPWVLQTIRGFHIELVGAPFQPKLPSPLSLSQQERHMVHT